MNSSTPRNSSSFGLALADNHSLICLPFRLTGAFDTSASRLGETKPSESLANALMSCCICSARSALIPFLSALPAALATAPNVAMPLGKPAIKDSLRIVHRPLLPQLVMVRINIDLYRQLLCSQLCSA